MDFVNFAAEVVELEELEATGRARARIVPYGVAAPYGTGTVRFEAGGLELPSDPVPVTIDHGTGVLDRIGVLTGFEELEDGAYGELRFSDVPAAQSVRTLLRDGAVTDVSIGVASPSTHGSGEARTMSGLLDHVSIVPRGRFRGDHGAGARVLAVHDTRPEEVDPMETNETMTPGFEAAAEDLRAEFRDTLTAELAEFGSTLDDLREQLAANPPPVAEHAWEAQLDAGIYRALGLGELAEHAIADVVGDLGTGDASPLAPDFYWAGGLQQNIDRRRPLFTMAGSATFPAYGNDLTSARLTQEVQVGTAAAEKAEPASRALTLTGTTFPIVAHKGVVDVSMELMKRSNPDVMRVLRDSYMRQYAISTNADLATKVEAAGTETGAVLDTSDYASLASDLITQSNVIEDATGLPGDRLAVTGAQWAVILGLVDSADRRQFSRSGDAAADGSALLTARAINVAGIWIFRDYSVSHAIQYNELTIRVAEDTPEVMADRNLSAMGYDVGLFGQTVAVLWPAGIIEYVV